MSDNNTEIEQRIAEADQVLEACHERDIDPVQVLRQAVEQHDATLIGAQ